MININNVSIASIAMVILISISDVYAEDVAELLATLKSYDRVYFDAYQPRTALDMVDRVPGFLLIIPDDKRGLGQGGANVLINGNRLTGKTQARAQLNRINSRNVERLEVVDGASLDIPGLSGQVVNVVTHGSPLSVSWEMYPEWKKDYKDNWARGKFSVSGETGPINYAVTVGHDSYRNGQHGPARFFDANNQLFEQREEVQLFNGDEPYLSFDSTWQPNEDQIGNLNFKYSKFDRNSIEDSSRNAITPRGESAQAQFTSESEQRTTEIGLDYQFTLGDGKLKTTLFSYSKVNPSEQSFSKFDAVGNALVDQSVFKQRSKETEAIIRGEYAWVSQQGHDWQVALEGARNKLDINSQLFVLDTDGELIEAALDGASAIVDEDRVELTMTHSRKIQEDWNVQASLGVEQSTIEQTNGLSRSFERPKGFLAASYRWDPSTTLRAKIEREVGQLSFFDFISSIDLDENQDSAGNVNLVPSQTWLAEFEVDKKWKDKNALQTKFYLMQIDDLVDRIPLESGLDAIGNLDVAKRYGLDINATIDGKNFGWQGVEVKIKYQWSDSFVDDPVEGFTRQLTDHRLSNFNLFFRHDIPDTPFAYGVDLYEWRKAPEYRLDRIDRFNFSGSWGELYVEHKDFFGLKVKAKVENFLNGKNDNVSRIFTDRRDQGELDYVKSSTRLDSTSLILTVSGEF